MNITDAQFVFPVFGFRPEATIGWQWDGLEEITTAREPIFSIQSQKGGLELVDANGSRWAVKSMGRVGRSGSLLAWVLGVPFGHNRCRLEWDLEPLPPLSLIDVQNRACDAAVRFGEVDDWNEELEAETAAHIASIRDTQSIAELAPILNWPSFSA